MENTKVDSSLGMLGIIYLILGFVAGYLFRVMHVVTEKITNQPKEKDDLKISDDEEDETDTNDDENDETDTAEKVESTDEKKISKDIKTEDKVSSAGTIAESPKNAKILEADKPAVNVGVFTEHALMTPVIPKEISTTENLVTLTNNSN